MSSTGGQTSIHAHLSLPPGTPDRPSPALRVYLFDSAGRLADSAPAQERVSFDVNAAQRYRVTLGPDLLTNDRHPPSDLAQRLRSASAVSHDYLPARKDATIAISASSALISLWLLNCVNVHGSVRKLLNPGAANPTYAPICSGTVQVFRINYACTLDRLSAAELVNLKNTILGRAFNREISDIVNGNFGDLVAVDALVSGLIPLNGAALKTYIVAHRAALAPLMCEVIPEFDICYEQYPDALIQSDGTFSTEICFLSWQKTDLYFEVVQGLDGVSREISDPDIVCTTMFNYNGSQPAVITVTDPTAIACQPDPHPGPAGLYVWPTAIGNIDLREIQGLETMTGTGLLAGPDGPIPWGGQLPLQMQFHPDLRANDIRYYRWSYRFDGDSGFTQIHTSVTHRWQEISAGPGGTIVIHLHSVALGPRLVGTQSNLFEIPDPALDWINIVDPLDRPFAYFDSTDGQTPGRSGMCTLKLEMFNGAGNHVASSNVGHAAGVFKFLLPVLAGPAGVYTDASASNIDANWDLLFRIQVDNNPTRARLYDVTTASHGSGDDCGMRHYSGDTDKVRVHYAATHPNNFLDWSLGISRGTHGQVTALAGHSSSTDPAIFENNASVLLGRLRPGRIRGQPQLLRQGHERLWPPVTI